MLTLVEWLRQVGFQGRNPFGNKQADDEGDLLQAYFVEHPAYNAMLDFDPPRSSILHAPRGAGKSSSRRMFQDHCASHAAEIHPLLVPLLDWMPLARRAGGIGAITPQHHVEELYHQTVRELANRDNPDWLKRPQDPDQAAYLNWICRSYDRYLQPAQRKLLHERGWVAERAAASLSQYRIEELDPLPRLELLVSALQAIGYQTCFVLIDRIDELLETVSDWEAGATMLAPLIGNLGLNQIPGLAFKYFIPSEIIGVLRRRGVLREDRISCSELSWGGPQGRGMLLKLLHNRLSVFSKDQIQSLAAIAEPDLRDIDGILVDAAQESPRRLLNLGDTLFHARASTADRNDLLIEREHLEEAFASLGVAPPTHLLAGAALPGGGSPTRPETSAAAGQPSPDIPIPLLRLDTDGSIWRGDEMINGWQRLPALQRRLLEYLYEHPGRLCSRNELIEYVWEEKNTPADEDSLHKLAGRLIRFVERDSRHPIYIQRVFGGFYRLDNVAPDQS